MAREKPALKPAEAIAPFFSPCLFEIIAILFFRLRRLIIQITRTFCLYLGRSLAGLYLNERDNVKMGERVPTDD